MLIKFLLSALIDVTLNLSPIKNCPIRLRKEVLPLPFSPITTNSGFVSKIDLAGQYPVVCKAKKNVANFKLRVGQPCGMMVTLRGDQMYQFIDRLVHNAFPRIRDFRGIPKKGFDHVGNYNLGVPDVSIFTEIDLDKIKYPLGLNITFVTTAKTDAAAKELLSLMDFPFAH